MEFKIGDRVEVKKEDRIFRNDIAGVVTDVMFSNRYNTNLYKVSPSEDEPPIGVFASNELELITVQKQYRFCTVIEDGVVIVTMEESMGHDDLWNVVARGHGHLIHDGDAGIAQAFSYAARRLWGQLEPSDPGAIRCTKTY